MEFSKVEFPLYKLRSYIDIEKNLMGKIKIQTIKGIYILDDYAYNGTFEQRRLKIQQNEPQEKIYKLKERIIYLRQLVKYRSGTTFIDNNGAIIRYIKSSKQYIIESYKIIRKRQHERWTIINLEHIELPFIVGTIIPPTTTHASVMHTRDGPFLYDLTSKGHKPYRRKI
jgi:hypothetical protein